MSQATVERADQRRRAVFSACTALEEAGEPISIKAVVTAIGGSNTTAAKYIKEWKEERFREAPETDPELYELTRGFRDQAMRFVEGKLTQAQQRAEKAEAQADEARQDRDAALLREEEADAKRQDAVRRAEESDQKAANSERARSTAVGEKDGYRRAQQEAADQMERVTAKLKETVRDAGVERQAIIDQMSSLESAVGKIGEVVGEVGKTPERAASIIQAEVGQIEKIVAGHTERNARIWEKVERDLPAAIEKEINGVQEMQQAAIRSAAQAAAQAAINEFQPWFESTSGQFASMKAEVTAGMAELKQAQASLDKRIKAMENAQKKARKND